MVKKTVKKEDDADLEQIPESEVDSQRYLELVQDVLENTQANIRRALNLLKENNIDAESLLSSLKATKEASEGFIAMDSGKERIIEGVFNGEKMVGGDGTEYLVPANYASKSKLVEGDMLKLTITKNGSFIYKQIGPVERIQKITTLVRDENTNTWYAVDGAKRWKLLTASVTYFHGDAGDEIVILIPRDGTTRWASVENIIHVKS